jgi:hypothetical protein
VQFCTFFALFPLTVVMKQERVANEVIYQRSNRRERSHPIRII